MNAKRLNGKNGKNSVNGNDRKQKRVLSAQKMQKLERLGFDADLVELIHSNWRLEKRIKA